MSDRFDPFTDRTSREIRNRLSNALMRALDPLRSDLFESVISELLDQDPVPTAVGWHRVFFHGVLSGLLCKDNKQGGVGVMRDPDRG